MVQPTRAKSEALMRRARHVIAGGDSSTMRVLPYALPLVAERGDGARLWDADGNELIDLNMAYGPLLFGHRPRWLVERVVQQLTESGSQLGFQSELGIRVAEKLRRFYPSMELMRFANSGTEAVASALRVARAYTGKRSVVVFEGHYHGWSESAFHRYHAPLDDLRSSDYGPAAPGTEGMNGPEGLVVTRYNNVQALEKCLHHHRGDVAAIVLEPVMGNAGVIPPNDGFLDEVRRLSSECGALMVFDEVISGIRLSPGGAQDLYRIRPDLTIVSKALGSGFPVAAFGGRRGVMEVIESGRVFHGGVYSANAMVMAAADAVLDHLEAHGSRIYSHLRDVGNALATGLDEVLTHHGRPHIIQQVGSMLGMFLTDGNVDAIHEYRDVRAHCSAEAYIELQHRVQEGGVFYHPNHFEPMYVSTAHSLDDVAEVLRAFDRALS